MNSRTRNRSSALSSIAIVVAVVFSIIFGLYYSFKDSGVLTGTFSSALDRKVSLEVARSEAERERGLMFRNVLPENHGMLFVFDNVEEHTFWMKNTPLSLDLIFLDDALNVVGLVEAATPFSETGITVSTPSRYVIELKAGTARALGISSGMPVIFYPKKPIDSFSE